MELRKGYTIQTKNFKKAIVEQKLGEGGQGAVYRVNYDGKAKVLKWYSGKKFKNPDKFYANLQNNVKKRKTRTRFFVARRHNRTCRISFRLYHGFAPRRIQGLFNIPCRQGQFKVPNVQISYKCPYCGKVFRIINFEYK